MAAQYHSLFTTQGLALLREAIQNGTKLGITHMAYGDGNGIVPTPNADFTKLIKEVYRTPLNRLAPSKENANWLEADGVIPSAVGGFNIREVGLYAGNILVAYANYPATYKPSADQGTAQIKTIRIVLQIDNTANFELKIDASVVMATIQTVEDAKLEAIKYADNTKLHIVDSIDELLDLKTWHGRTVLVKGFYKQTNAEIYKGGDEFYFNDALRNVYDGIINFNGWVRNCDPYHIKSSQAGLTGNESQDAQPIFKRINAYFKSLNDNIPKSFHLESGTFKSKTVEFDPQNGNTYYMLSYRKNMKITGEGSSTRIVIPDDVMSMIPNSDFQNQIQFRVFYSEIDSFNNDFKDFVIDFNGDTNFYTKETIVSNNAKSIYGFFFAGHKTHKKISLENIEFYRCPSFNCIFAIGSKKTINSININACRFIRCGDSSNLGINKIADHSSIFLCGSNNSVTNCLFENDEESYVSAAIELHNDGMINGNRFINYAVPFHLVTEENLWFADGGGGISICSNNYVYNALYGITHNFRDKEYTSATFEGNYIHLRSGKANKDKVGGLLYRHSGYESGGGVNWASVNEQHAPHIYLLNNVFEQAEPESWSNDDCLINNCMSVKNIFEFTAKGNTFKNFKGAVLEILQQDGVNIGNNKSKFILDHNTYINCGFINGFNLNTCAYTIKGDGQTNKVLGSLYVNNDVFIDCKYDYVLGAAATAVVMNKVRISDVQFDCVDFVSPYFVNSQDQDTYSDYSLSYKYATKRNFRKPDYFNFSRLQNLRYEIEYLDYSNTTSKKVMILKNPSIYSSPQKITYSNISPTQNNENHGIFDDEVGDLSIITSVDVNQYKEYIFRWINIENKNGWYGFNKVTQPS